MIHLFNDFLQNLRTLGPAGVLILSILDSAGVPVIGGVDALVIWVSITTPALAYSAAAMAALGSLIGSLFLFFLARKGGEAYLAHHSTGPKGARLRAWFLEYGLLTILVPAIMPILPLPLKVFIICAGALGVNPFVFTLIMAISRIVRYFALAWLGLRLGNRTLPFLLHYWWEFLLFAILLFASLYYLIKRADRKRRLGHLVTDPE